MVSCEAADRSWLGRLVTRRVAPGDVARAFERTPGDVEAVLDFVP
ncbi:hypothetical protein [Kitasatospora sp. NPDC056531]